MFAAKQILSTSLVAALAAISLAACAPASSHIVQLPDDPESEALNPDVPASPDRTVESLALRSPATDAATKRTVLAKYAHLDPSHKVPTSLLEKAVLTFDANSSSFANKRYISVIDFSKRSTNARFWIINMSTGAVQAIHVAHGKGSDSNHDGYAERFSNTSGSNASSLGVYRAAEQYSGSHGKSMRLDGLSSTNSRARARAVVIHPASYVQESSVIQGRSWGCPAIAPALSSAVIDKLKNGSMLLIDTSGQR